MPVVSKNVHNEYTYYVYESRSKKIKDNSKRLMLKVLSNYHGPIYNGPAHKYLAFLEKEKARKNEEND